MGMTKDQFGKLDVLEQGRVKWKFLQAHFAAFVRIQASNVLDHLAVVLHRNDLEQIERDMQNKSNNIVMQNLLMRLSRTCKPWWIPLEEYLLEEGDNKLYSFLNPWRELEEHGATAASPGGFFRNSDRSSGDIHRPYSCDTPLGKTSGLVDVLRSCPWRKLGDVLGFNMDEQLAIKRSASCDNDFHQHLIDTYIEKCRSNATVGSLVRALLQLYPEGRQIVSFMEEAKLIVSYEREGSEAGEARGEELCGFNITESASGASASNRQASLSLNHSHYSLSTTVTNNFSTHGPMNESSAHNCFPSSAFHPAVSTDRVVSRNNQESVSTSQVQEALHRLAPSPGTTQPSQINREMESPFDSTSYQNSEPGNFTDYETPPNILEGSDLMQSLGDNASQPDAGDVKDLNTDNHTEDKAYPQKYCNPSHPTDDQEDGDSSILQTDGPCEDLPATASACSDFTDGRDSSTASSHYSQQPTNDVPSAAELVGSTPQPGNTNSNITINVNFQNCKGSILNIGKKNKVYKDLPILQELTYEVDEDRHQEFDSIIASVSSPPEANFERSGLDTTFCPQECQQGIRVCPACLISAGQNLVTEGEAFPWNPNLHQTLPKQIMESESEAATGQVTEMDQGDANDVNLMLHRRLISKDPEEQMSHGHEDTTFSNAAAKSSQAGHQISNSGNSRSQQEEANAEDAIHTEWEKEGVTLTAPLTDKQCEGQQDQPQQPSGLLKRFSQLLKDARDFME